MAPIQSRVTKLMRAPSGDARGFYLAKQGHLYLMTGYPRWKYDGIYKDRRMSLDVFPKHMITISGMTEVTVTGKVGCVWKPVSNHTR